MTIYLDGTELVFERTFDAPGTTTTVLEMDVRPGGTWRYLSRALDRDDVTFYGEYVEIEPPSRFTWTFLFDVEGLGAQGGPATFTFDVLGRVRGGAPDPIPPGGRSAP